MNVRAGSTISSRTCVRGASLIVRCGIASTHSLKPEPRRIWSSVISPQNTPRGVFPFTHTPSASTVIVYASSSSSDVSRAKQSCMPRCLLFTILPMRLVSISRACSTSLFNAVPFPSILSTTICHAVCTGNALARICTLISCGIGAMHCFGLLTSLAYAGAV